ncbi:MAG: hypothetical protein A2992_07920 [Elusimicrobia bacterium RIFCSPLOWO2_01_FULL_59_12]|nr:MAG: hypothetical protein A2992_07920 [Elusimicrobia bacterium RIFCSPLOWO2_01_FULL_59_12]
MVDQLKKIVALCQKHPGTVLTIAWLLTRLTYMFTQPRGWIYQDWEYGEFANRFLQTGALAWHYPWIPQPIPSAMVPPGLIFILVFLKKFLSQHYFVAWALVQFVVAGGTWAFFWATCRQILSPRALWLAGLLFIFDVNLYSPMRWVNETPFSMLFMMMFVFTLVEWDRQPSIRTASAIGAILGLGGLFHSTFSGQIPVALGWILWRSRFNGTGWRKGRFHGMALLIAWIVILTPWTVRNFRTFHRFIPTDLHLGRGLWVGWNAQSCGSIYKLDGSPMDYEPDLVQRLEKLKTEPEIDAELMRTAFDHALSNPRRWIKQRVFCFLFFWHEHTFWAPNSPFRTRKAFVLGLYNLFLIAVFFPCAIVAWRGGGPSLRLILVVIGLLCLLHTLTLADIGNRYRMPLEPLLVIVMGYSLARLLHPKAHRD